jgi:CubicO group peptidase (beta-lactamase class C family)
MNDNSLQRVSPEMAGIPSAAVLHFVDRIEETIDELHSFMLLRHGQVAAEGWWQPYVPQRPHVLFSLSKSFTSTAIGLAVAEGLLTVDDLLLSFFPEEAPANADANLNAMRVRHVLSMATGHDQDTSDRVFSKRNWVKAFLSLPVEHEPGTHFVYNTAATYMLSAIIQKLTGQTLLDYLEPRLFQPLGIQGAAWETCPMGINTGGYGLSIKTEDIARFGQLYLQQGVWNGQRLIAEDWVAEATSKQIVNGDNLESDWNQGYGYQFWRCRHNAYRGDGAFGQFCLVLPEQDAVLAITAGTDDMQGVLNIIWETLLPAMGPALSPDPQGCEHLARRLSGLSARIPGEVSENEAVTEQAADGCFGMEANELGIQAMGFAFEPDGCVLEIEHARGVDRIPCGYQEWREGETALDPRAVMKTAAAARWSTKNKLVILLRLVETPFYRTLTCDFDGDRLAVGIEVNVAFGEKPIQRLQGKAR